MTIQQYLVPIAEIDKTLSLVREMWLEASPDSPEKRKAMLRIDGLLDERFRLMKARDAAQADVASAATVAAKKTRVVKKAVPPVNPPLS